MNKKVKRRVLLICIVLVVAAAVTVGLWIYRSGETFPTVAQNEEGTGDLSVEDDSTQYEQEEKDNDFSISENTGSRAGESDTSEGEKEGIVSQEGVNGISLPHAIAGSNLIIERITSYDGAFIEDGSDSDISGVTAVVLQNAGDTDVEFASIPIYRDGTELQFEVSALPAGSTIVVQEKNRVTFQEGNYSVGSATVAEVNGFEMSEDKVHVEETGDQTFTLTNLTEEEIPAVRIFYKFYMEDEDVYVGGITYVAKVTNLAADSSQTVTASHYLKGSSRIMMVRTYDSAEE